jgi:S-adenosylmethionine/arginine decarboxylase-like enzyme
VASETLVHHHLIYQAEVGRNDLNETSSGLLVAFLEEMVAVIRMHILIPPQVAFSDQKAWTGIVGIVTSHISFHYWPAQGHLQLDIYSCKAFDVEEATSFLSRFWEASNARAIFIERAITDDFKITKF